MKLLSLSFLSIISRFTAVGIGIAQTLIIAELLTAEELGLRGLAFKISTSFGLFLSLGLSSSLTRQISVSDDDTEKSGVFLTGLILRYILTLPIVILLIVGADSIANYYSYESLKIPLQILGATLFVEAGQIVFDAAIKGFRKFYFIIIFQIVISILSLVLLITFINYQGFLGIFYAHLTLNTIWSILMLLYVLKIFNWKISLPNYADFINYIKILMSIGLFLYVIKICTTWLNLPEILLASKISGTMLGAYAFAYMISSKISQVSDAITDISLPSMSNVFAKDSSNYKTIFLDGNAKAIYLISIVTLLLIVFKHEAITVLDYFIAFISPERIPFTVKFADSFIIINYLAIAFWSYAVLNLFQAGLNVPTKKMLEVTISYIILITSTYILYMTLPIVDFILKMNISFAAGSIIALIINILLSSRKLKWFVLKKETLFMMIFFLLLVYINTIYTNIYIGVLSLLTMILPFKKFI